MQYIIAQLVLECMATALVKRPRLGLVLSGSNINIYNYTLQLLQLEIRNVPGHTRELIILFQITGSRQGFILLVHNVIASSMKVTIYKKNCVAYTKLACDTILKHNIKHL